MKYIGSSTLSNSNSSAINNTQVKKDIEELKDKVETLETSFESLGDKVETKEVEADEGTIGTLNSTNLNVSNITSNYVNAETSVTTATVNAAIIKVDNATINENATIGGNETITGNLTVNGTINGVLANSEFETATIDNLVVTTKETVEEADVKVLNAAAITVTSDIGLDTNANFSANGNEINSEASEGFKYDTLQAAEINLYAVKKTDPTTITNTVKMDEDKTVVSGPILRVNSTETEFNGHVSVNDKVSFNDDVIEPVNVNGRILEIQEYATGYNYYIGVAPFNGILTFDIKKNDTILMSVSIAEVYSNTESVATTIIYSCTDTTYLSKILIKQSGKIFFVTKGIGGGTLTYKLNTIDTNATAPTIEYETVTDTSVIVNYEIISNTSGSLNFNSKQYITPEPEPEEANETGNLPVGIIMAIDEEYAEDIGELGGTWVEVNEDGEEI